MSKHRKLSPLRVVLIVLVACASVSCGRPGKPKLAPVSGPPMRIVSLAPNVTEILFFLGLGDRIVGVTGQCNYPPEARKKHEIGDVSTSVERVIAARPDLVVAHAFLNREAIRSLRSLGVKVTAVNPKTLDQVAACLRTIGVACGNDRKAASLAAEMRDSVSKITKKYSAAAERPKVLFAVQASPLWVAGPQTFVDEMIHKCGAFNVVNKAKPGFNLFSEEAAVAFNPDFIIVTDKPARDYFLRAAAWKNTNAVRGHRVVQVNPDLYLREGPRLVDGMRKLGEILHPGKLK